jgi:hypothetical protein
MSNVGRQMATNIVRAGLFTALVCPVIVVTGFSLWFLMPHCTAGSSGPADGCTLLGLNLNWFMNLVVLAFLGAFFLVPLGVVIVFVGKYFSQRESD